MAPYLQILSRVSAQNFSTLPRSTKEKARKHISRIAGSSYFSIIRNFYGGRGIGLTVEIDTTVSVHVHFLDHILD